MGDDVFDRILDAAALVARRSPKLGWHQRVSRAFRRDVTCFDWRLNSLLDDLGVVHRNYPSKARIPGRVACAFEPRDSPPAEVCFEFLGRGGTLILEGTELFDVLELVAKTESLPVGRLPVAGPLLDELRLAPEFWADKDATTIAIPDAVVNVATARGPLVSTVAHHGGTVVVFATSAYSYDRGSKARTTASPRQLAAEHGIAITDPTDRLADDTPLPRDLFVAEITMASVLGHVIATALAT